VNVKISKAALSLKNKGKETHPPKPTKAPYLGNLN